MKYSLDWSHKTDKTIFYDGKKILKKLPDLKRGDIIYCENLPLRLSKPIIQAGAKIFRVHQNLIADYRVGKGIEKTDENDAKLIYEYAEQHLENFKPYYGETPIKLMYATFKETQKLRIATGQRVWAIGETEGNGHTMKKIEDIEKEAEKDLLKELEMLTFIDSMMRDKGKDT